MVAPRGRPFYDNAVTGVVETLAVGPTEVMLFHAMNVNSADAFVQIFANTAGAITLGTTVPALVVHVPRGDSTLRGSFTMDLGVPCLFTPGMSYAATTTPGGAVSPVSGLELSAVVAAAGSR